MRPASVLRLVLWDIDGTILHGGRLWAECFMDSFRARFAGEVQKIPFSGKTDRQICRELMEAGGHWTGDPRAHATDIDLVIRGYLDRARAGVVAHADQIRLLPGVREVIGALRKRPEVTLGLLTGNVREGAWLKLGAVGLREEFGFGPGDGRDGARPGWDREHMIGVFGDTGDTVVADASQPRPARPHSSPAFGAFGCDHSNRYELPGIAVAKAQRELGLDFSAKQVVIIGDTIHDVGCGQSIGARAIGVGTGQPEARARVESAFRGRPLEAGDPVADAFFEDLSDIRAVTRAILS